MMPGQLFPRTGAIGLDVGARYVKAAQLRHTGRRTRLRACARFGRAECGAPLSVAELRQIGAILRRQGFVGKEVIVAAPPDALRAGMLELPARAPGVPLEQIAHAEFSRMYKCDSATAELSWWELPSAARAVKGIQAAAVALPHAAADRYLSLFDEAGFSVKAVDVAGSALARACCPLAAPVRNFAVLDLGWNAAGLVLVHGGVVIYERRIPEVGWTHLISALDARAGTGIEAAEHLAGEMGLAASKDVPGGAAAADVRDLIARHVDACVEEVVKTLSYANHQYPDGPVELLLLGGGAASVRGIGDHFRAAVEIEVRPAALERCLDCESDVQQRLVPALATAVGLARFE